MRAVQIRHGRETDTDALAALVPDSDRRFWRVRHALDGMELLLVAEADGLIVGVASVRWKAACDPPNPWIYGGEVVENWRGRGVGSMLWRAAHEECRDRGYELVSLDVDVENVAARRLYERLGYEVIGPHAHRWVARDEAGGVTGEGTADTWLMRCGLRKRRLDRTRTTTGRPARKFG